MSLKEKFGFHNDPVYLIDGSSFLYRGFYAYGDLSRSDGFPTNALFIVMRLLLRVLKDEKPRYAMFFLDGKGPNFRHELFPEYKANRQAMPEPLAQQIEPLKEGVSLLGLPVAVSSGAEADDYIASMANRLKAERPVVIVGSDKDLRQCLDDNVLLWDPAGKQEKLVTLGSFADEFPIPPSSWPDLQALTGDSSDNIPGVPGIGPKTALDILSGRPTLEDVRDHLGDLKPAQQKKLEGHMEKTFLYRELTRLRTDLGPETPPDGLAVRPMDTEAVKAFLLEYEFRSLARELPQGTVPATAESAASTGSAGAPAAAKKAAKKASGAAQASLFDAPIPEKTPQEAPKDTPFDSGEWQEAAPKRLGLVPVEGGFVLGFDGKERLFTGGPAELVPLLAGAQRIAVPSFKDLIGVSPVWEEIPLDKWMDLELCAYLLNPEQRNYSWERLRDSLYADPSFDHAALPPGARGLAALALADIYAPRLEQAGLAPLVRDLEMPLIPVLSRMEKAGVVIDRQAFASFLDEASQSLDALTAEITALAGKPFNLRSSQQLAEILFTDLGLKRQGKTPGGAVSTSSEVLEKLRGEHEIVGKILEYRKLEKLRSTYLEPLPRMVDDSGRLHTTFNQLATATGRLSSSNPNLQNIPIRGEFGRRMRSCFIAAPGMELAAADYSQIELRVLAHLSKEPTLLAAFAENRDIHAGTAALLFDKPLEEVAPDERRNAKTINFGLLYGMGPQKLSRELGIKLDEAKAFIARYFERLSGLRAFYDSVVEEAEKNGFVTTIAGRRRLLPEIRSRNAQMQSQAKRQAINTVVQGSAADIIKMAMLAVDRDEALRDMGARLLLQVHDELVAEAPQDAARAAGERLAALMSGVVTLDVPLAVDLGVGPDWGAAH